jgi:hypothetical protein
MFCFDSIAKAIIGKSCSSIIASTTNNATIPPEIAAIVSLKFTFAVIFNQRLFASQNKVLLIKSIVAAHQREYLLPYTEQNIQIMHPSTPVKHTSISTQHGSPSLPMSKFSTDASASVRQKDFFSHYLSFTIHFQIFLYVSNYMQVNRSLIYSPHVSPRDNNTVTLCTIMYSTLAYRHSPFTIQQCTKTNLHENEATLSTFESPPKK